MKSKWETMMQMKIKGVALLEVFISAYHDGRLNFKGEGMITKCIRDRLIFKGKKRKM